mmetsp:Transcript_1311/g.2845  ORF Transcript_1311/g.2845 Transcript_1311/m.2845 type:complete len:697 (-) Transcript_1311:591-2681(-)|eukprot:CAMPEP_0202906440 /NCGR_PEP_ID=MMETSP1392-20130828/38957_1 /ASSEMBLY_ACC=CAM_ASM_000868 /TAXON_ID=225041 /ORGANISM="Chlamydomonas chlamydogama, Strain SAG 11-48b" /LENGTH=696 /DNA_ID=CAMNT_0049594957 /DNA_START=5 /DNA_END=2095 /DNA_ORIENTATION=+
MANVSNAFSLLVGTGEVVASSKKKKQNKNKPKQEDLAGRPTSAPAPIPTSVAPAAKAANTAQVVDVHEAIAILERAAREAKTMAEKGRLWKDWTRQATDRSGKGLKYKDSDGTILEFKQVLLRSKALEIAVESSLTSGLGPEKEESLSQLLSVFFSNDSNPSLPHVLASQLVRLSGLLSDEAPDTLGAAQRAVSSVIAALKTGVQDQGSGDTGALSAWVGKVSTIDKDIAKQQGLLQKLAATSGGVVTKEQVNCAKTIFKLSEEKFDLLQPENIPSFKPASGAAETTLKTLEELKRVIKNHLKEATALEESVKGKPGSAEAQRMQTLAAFHREEQILASEGQQVAAQIRTLEAQLRALKAKMTEIDDKRGQLQQRSRALLDSMGSSHDRPSGVLSATHYQNEVAVVDSLCDLVDPSRQQGASPQEVLAIQTSQGGSALEYVSHGQRFLSLAVGMLHEIPGKLNFCKQRLSQAEKLIKLGAGNSKQKEEAEKLLADTLRGADELMRTSMQVVSEVNQRYDVIVRFAPENAPAASEQLRAIDALSVQIRSAYDNVQAANRAQAVEAPPPAANGRGPKAAAVPAVPAAAPVPTPSLTVAPAPAPKPIAAPVTTVDQLAALGISNGAANGPAAAKKSAPAPAAAAPRPVSAPPKQWAKVNHAVPADSGDSSLPTPAEAFKAAAADDDFKPVGAKKNRKKA